MKSNDRHLVPNLMQGKPLVRRHPPPGQGTPRPGDPRPGAPPVLGPPSLGTPGLRTVFLQTGGPILTLQPKDFFAYLLTLPKLLLDRGPAGLGPR